MAEATKGKLVLALDTGTTSGRALVIDASGVVLASAQQEAGLITPRPGWVEQDAEELWQAQLATARAALEKAGVSAADVAGIGITNQRETTVVWDRATSVPVAPAIVWQDRRTAALLRGAARRGTEALVAAQDRAAARPVLLRHQAPLAARQRARRARARRGRASSPSAPSTPGWSWRLSGGRCHVTDATNASRTLLYDIRDGDWDDELLALFGVPRGAAARGRGQQRRRRRERPGAARRRRPDRRHRRRPAGGALRPGVLAAGDDRRSPTAPAASCC